jgi:hypothetical protein
MGILRFRALIELDPVVPDQAVRPYLNSTRALMIRPVFPGDPERLMLFPAEISWDDEVPLEPGDRAVVTITFTGELAASFFTAGRRFSIWHGCDVGHGTISRGVFTTGDPSLGAQAAQIRMAHPLYVVRRAILRSGARCDRDGGQAPVRRAWRGGLRSCFRPRPGCWRVWRCGAWMRWMTR